MEGPPEPVVPRTRARKRNLEEFHVGIGGARFRYDDYPHPVLGSYKNWILQCPLHDGCSRSRKHIPAFTAAFGDIEPLAYLHVRLAVQVPTEGREAKHSLKKPTAAQVAAFVAEHRAELEEIVRLHGPRV